MNIRKITTGSLMIAIATVLSMIPLIRLPQEGTVTLASMAPIIVFSFISDFKSSLITAFAYSLIQMMLGGIAPPAENFLSYMLVIMLDYVIAFSVLGCAGVIRRRFKNLYAGSCIAVIAVTFLRFICHFLSGILIWSVYAPEGQSAFWYSLVYNGSYMSFEIIITSVVVTMLAGYLERIKKT